MDSAELRSTLLLVHVLGVPGTHLCLDQTLLRGEDALTRSFGNTPGTRTHLCVFNHRVASFVWAKLREVGLGGWHWGSDWQAITFFFRACVLVTAEQTRAFINFINEGGCRHHEGEAWSPYTATTPPIVPSSAEREVQLAEKAAAGDRHSVVVGGIVGCPKGDTASSASSTWTT